MACELPWIEPRSTAELPTTLTSKPNSGESIHSLHVHETIPFLQNGELSFPNCRNSIIRYFFSQISKCRYILFHILMYSSVDEKRRPQIRACFWARRRNKITHGNCDFISTKCFINVSWLSESTDCAAENSKSRVMLRDQRGDQPSNNWENLSFSSDSARILAFSSQRHT